MFEQFRKRSYQLERLDTGDYSPREYARWHREMWFIHRIYGELRALKSSLLREIQAGEKPAVSVLDVGAGAGELLSELQKWLAGTESLLIGAELNGDAVAAIRDARINAVQCDAMRLPFGDGSFDYAFCSLFLHHLGDEAAIDMIREMGRVASEKIFVIDLNRDPTAYYLYKYVGGLFLQRFTREDGALSILRSFTLEEMHELAEKAGLVNVTVTRSKANRLVLSGSSK